ncbi:MAG: (deoxy)nucleoside triphosphate pyrophosphohydrolase [Clostridia bacterium]|nr:(deoxy)nucleoside triphosphate pyrophosphohydrolase [Clostridia bacterium]
MTRVVAALIRRGNRFLICQRPPHKVRGLLWEFVGGKVEPGETDGQALVRECREELGVTVQVGAPYAQLVHTYPDLTVQLTLYRAVLPETEQPQLLEHSALRWITPDEIDRYAFCPADEAILARLKKESAGRA